MFFLIPSVYSSCCSGYVSAACGIYNITFILIIYHYLQQELLVNELCSFPCLFDVAQSLPASYPRGL